MFKKLFENWNLFEYILLGISWTAIIVSFFLETEKNYLSFFTSLLGVYSVILIAKGLLLAPITDIAYNVLYAILAFTQRYYGESIIYVFLMIPISSIAIYQWLHHKDENNKSYVRVNKIFLKEFVILIVLTILLSFLFFFLLRALNTNNLVISTISLSTSVLASYFFLRRSSFYALFFILNDIILIGMWSMILFSVGIEYLPTVISLVAFFVNDIYGFVIWKKKEKKL